MHEKARDAKRLNFEAPMRRPHNHKAPTQPQGAHVRCHGLGLRCETLTDKQTKTARIKVNDLKEMINKKNIKKEM